MSAIVVGISEIRYAERPARLLTYGLGSCVAVVVYWAERGEAGMAHVMLPMAYAGEAAASPGKFADSAVASMVQEFRRRGAAFGDLWAKMAGGADMFPARAGGPGARIGARNAVAARRALEVQGVPVLASDVGGAVGRTVEFATETGALAVRTLGGGTREI